MTTCTICYSNELSEFICPYCKFQACQLCNQKFIEDRLIEPICMNCGKIWSREFLLNNAENKQWVYRHIGKYILEKEKMLLPETQEEASKILEIKNLLKGLHELPTNAKIKRMYKHFDSELLQNVLEEKQELRKKVLNVINDKKDQTITYSGRITSTNSKKIVHYIFKCPRECRGFISNNYDCGTCKKSICKLCHFELDLGHKCNKDDIKSASIVSSSTKPCPKCLTCIFKSGGCDQMFCTQCNTAFSWISGEIELGLVHNPHYYEYLATLSSTSQTIDVIACGEIPDANMFFIKIIACTDIASWIAKLQALHRTIIHTRNVIMREWRINNIKDNLDLRIQYLLNELDCSVWEIKLMNREKKRMKIKSVYDLLQLIIVVMEDFVRKVYSFDQNLWHDNVHNIFKEMNALKLYYRETLNQIFLIHGGKIPTSLLNLLIFM